VAVEQMLLEQTVLELLAVMAVMVLHQALREVQ
jgi:hypothetical protein